MTVSPTANLHPFHLGQPIFAGVPCPAIRMLC